MSTLAEYMHTRNTVERVWTHLTKNGALFLPKRFGPCKVDTWADGYNLHIRVEMLPEGDYHSKEYIGRQFVRDYYCLWPTDRIIFMLELTEPTVWTAVVDRRGPVHAEQGLQG